MNDGVFQNDAPYRIGHLDKRVTILHLIDHDDVDGVLTHQGREDAIGHKIWARIEPMRGRAYIETHKKGVADVVKITVRYRESIVPGMSVMYRDNVYEIDNVIDPAEAHAKLELMCSIRNAGLEIEAPNQNVSDSNTGGGTPL